MDRRDRERAPFGRLGGRGGGGYHSKVSLEERAYEAALKAATDDAAALYQTEPPPAIEADWSTVMTQVQPGVEGQSPFDVDAALDRVSSWVETDCSLEPELIARLKEPFDQ